jgi:hypothetical protein
MSTRTTRRRSRGPRPRSAVSPRLTAEPASGQAVQTTNKKPGFRRGFRPTNAFAGRGRKATSDPQRIHATARAQAPASLPVGDTPRARASARRARRPRSAGGPPAPTFGAAAGSPRRDLAGDRATADPRPPAQSAPEPAPAPEPQGRSLPAQAGERLGLRLGHRGSRARPCPAPAGRPENLSTRCRTPDVAVNAGPE